ncbi:helix-turn-helix domain-containing protein [Paracoccus methylarcula]|uniref:XRE family transcriptional regulator n=1 Tax=Paracoccus methylarcula TaxID=72022 RepID=A0A422QVI9_9RHOB|nr:helix-turn-helix transcriptional regulator [Paracoccus methylarcula]RNF33975.1 XRE family transcriptional regulator [Paracoccus methylarcula]
MDRSNQHLVAAFAATLRDAREDAGMTQEELAERADVSVRFISFLETGKRQPSLSALAAVSEGLGIPMSKLIVALEERVDLGDNPNPAVRSS